jgi:hypothetical protein
MIVRPYKLCNNACRGESSFHRIGKVAFLTQTLCHVCRDKDLGKNQGHSDNLILLEKADKLFIDIETDEEERVTKRIVKKGNRLIHEFEKEKERRIREREIEKFGS